MIKAIKKQLMIILTDMLLAIVSFAEYLKKL